MTPVCPKDNILVKIDKKFMDQTGTGLFVDPTWKPGLHATVTGKVVSTPLALSDHPQKRIIPMEVREGDDLAFAYRVVYNQTYSDNARDIFYEDPPESPYVTTWSNKNGMNLIRRWKPNNKFDGALYKVVDGKNEIIEKISGTKNEVNDFIGRHMPDRNNFIKYNNCLWDGDTELWKVDYQAAYMAIRHGTERIMIGGYVLLEHPNVAIDRGDYAGNLELWGDLQRETKKEIRAKVISIGTPVLGQPKLSVGEGDTVIVNSMTAQEYNFWGKDYLLVRQDQILGKAC